ncbi:MAG: hypothetical protein HZC02_05660 [Candidatus Levybacteria bacterium]|nr:hypothetical protein [Candidatus Levybacteria bacterium]
MKVTLSTKIILVLAVLLTLGVILVAVLAFISEKPESNKNTPIPTATPTTPPLPIDQKDIDEDLAPTQNPSYIKKINEQKFWNLLPYWSPNKHFKIEYKDSKDYILVTIFTNDASLTSPFQKEATTWLTQNGAQLENLTIKYETENYPAL